jgi:hypothetical protein
LIWVAERDACVRCLAYAGLHVLPGAKFEGGLTFGPRWASVIGRPPLLGPGWFEGEGSHPWCRCELRIIHLATSRRMADALKREARRSVAKGWARPTEGNTVRVVAAERLLSGAANLPKSVVAEARSRLGKPARLPARGTIPVKHRPGKRKIMTDTRVHPWMIDPRDGLPLRAVGVVAGRPVWPVMGASDDDDAEDEDESDDDAEDEDESTTTRTIRTRTRRPRS